MSGLAVWYNNGNFLGALFMQWRSARLTSLRGVGSDWCKSSGPVQPWNFPPGWVRTRVTSVECTLFGVWTALPGCVQVSGSFAQSGGLRSWILRCGLWAAFWFSSSASSVLLWLDSNMLKLCFEMLSVLFVSKILETWFIRMLALVVAFSSLWHVYQVLWLQLLM